MSDDTQPRQLVYSVGSGRFSVYRGRLELADIRHTRNHKPSSWLYGWQASGTCNPTTPNAQRSRLPPDSLACTDTLLSLGYGKQKNHAELFAI